MQTSYFLLNGKDKSGPFSYDQLKDQKITEKCMVWKEGMEEWKPVSQVYELRALMETGQPVPPPTPLEQEQIHKKASYKALISAILWLIPITVAAFALGGGFASDKYLEVNYIGSDQNTDVTGIRWVMLPLLSIIGNALPLTIIIYFFAYRLSLINDNTLKVVYSRNTLNQVIIVLLIFYALGLIMSSLLVGDSLASDGLPMLSVINWIAVPISIMFYNWLYGCYLRRGKSPLEKLLS